MRMTRRQFAAAGAAVLAAGRARAASEPIELGWEDLIPEDARGPAFDEFRATTGIVEHGELSSPFEPQDRSVPLNTAYNGEVVSLPGYMVPIRFRGTAVQELLLVPYAGACIHVPPPPPNQIVLVMARQPYEIVGYFEAIRVTGVLRTMAVETELAEIGYVMTNAEIEPYE